MHTRPRSHLRQWRLPLLVALTAVLSTTLSTASNAAQTLEQVRGEINAIESRLAAATDELAAIEASVGTLSDETAALEQEMAGLADEVAAADARIADRVRELYKRGNDDPMLQLMSGADSGEAIERAAMATHLLNDDRIAIETASAARTRATLVAEQLEIRQQELQAAQDAQAATLAAITADLERAQQIESQLEEEERRRLEEERRQRAEAERRRQAEEAARRAEEAARNTTTTTSAPAPPAPSGSMACPMGNPHSFSDTWGAPRSGGRSHKGVDILAPRGTPVYAIVNGVWDVRNPGNLAGNWAILRGDNGHSYYYMHLERHIVGDGARVSAGQQTATNGDTGNARGTPHVHFEYHPGGGGAVNPYPVARAACG